MNKIILTVQRIVKNENFEEEKKHFQEGNIFNRERMMQDRKDAGFPSLTNIENSLQVELSEEQFEAIKKAVIEKF